MLNKAERRVDSATIATIAADAHIRVKTEMCSKKEKATVATRLGSSE